MNKFPSETNCFLSVGNYLIVLKVLGDKYYSLLIPHTALLVIIWKMDVLQNFQYQLTPELNCFSKAIKHFTTRHYNG
jgi:hypothetical protein